MTDLSGLHSSPSSAALGSTRFFRPPLPSDYVARPHLCQRLAQGLDGKLLLLCAPAGFGKSCLAVEFCRSLPAHWGSQWLALDQRDGEAGRFLERLLQALQQMLPGLGGESLALLRLRQQHQPFDFEAWLDTLLEELATRLDAQQPRLLVLDDYHLAQSRVIDNCLQYLLNHLPAGLLLLVCSRQKPNWHLARLRLGREVLELAEQDLRLNAEETRQLFGPDMPLMAEELQQLLERSEGWVAGLRLWSLMRSQAEPNLLVPRMQGDEGLIRDYLLEEVIERQTPEVQGFLFNTAGLERFCAELCDEVRDAHDSADILQYLQANQVFLVPLDEQGMWFRYHHLFSDLLRGRAQASMPAATLHLRASRWLGNHGHANEAVEHALRAGRTDVAASLVQNFSEEQLLAEQNVTLLLRWKLDLPDELLASTPRLIVLYSWALALACQLDAAQELAACLQRFLPAPSAEEQHALLAQWAALTGFIARGRGDLQRADDYCHQALQSLPAERYGQRLMCLSSLANQALAQNDLLRARVVNRQALELAQRIGNPLFEALSLYDRARVLLCRGEVQRALIEVRRGLQCLQGLPVTREYAVRGRLFIYEGWLLLHLRQTEAARTSLQRGISEARACRDASLLIGCCALANLEKRAGRFTEAFAQLAEAERLMHIWDVPPIYYLAMITLTKCELWQAQGQLDMAAGWLQRLEHTYCVQGAAAPELRPQIHLHIELQSAWLKLAQGRHAEAQGLLCALIDRANSSGTSLFSRQAMILLVQLYMTTGQDRQAHQWLQECLQLGEGGSLLVFEALSGPTPGWLRSALNRCEPSALRDALAASLGPELQLDSGQSEALSARELAVLQLIAQGCSNQEISERLFISLHTVKTHARHINSKLGVERRTQAVARAKQLGVLS
jgi:LuxR family maltose regulon positive regulatory protein